MSLNKRKGKWIKYSLGCVLLLGCALGCYIFTMRRSAAKTPPVPSAEVKRGDFVDYIELRGEIAVRASAVIASPYNAGDLQILKLARTGSEIQKGDVVVEFDPSSLQRTADQSRAMLKQVEAEIARSNAQQRLAEEQIKTEMLAARFQRERARLDASTGDVVPAIENEKNALALEKAEQKLRELDSRLESRKIGLEADLAGINRRRDKAKADLEQTEKNMAALTLTSPTTGIITMLPNSRARTNLLGGGSTPVFKEGDRAYAGAAIAEIPDLATIQAKAPVSESDRGRVQPGQVVLLNIEAVPDKEHKGRVKDISPLAKVDYSSLPIKKNFDLSVELENPDSRLRPGMTATLRIEAERIHDALVIPAESVFLKNSQTVAYVLREGLYREQPVTLARRGVGKVMVSRGLNPGDIIALKDPEQLVKQ
jgi:HlyD family secretion protein